MIRKYKDVFLYKVLEKQLFGCRSVLDVGCGDNSPLGKIPKRFYSEGIDIYKKIIIENKNKAVYDKCVIGDIKKLNKVYKNKSFDAVIALDVVEHLTKNEALKLIKQMENIAVKKVIILTPNGFLKQDEYNGNPYQTHKCGWKKEELEKLGFKVYGLRGWKWIRGETASIKRKPKLFWGLLAFLSEIILFPFPSVCFDLLAVKNYE